MKLLLTSCGLETKAIENAFLEMLPRGGHSAKSLTVPSHKLTVHSKL